MDLPLPLPISPMLAKAAANLPEPDAVPGGWVFEPKWDGFRCIACFDGAQVELLSRSKKPLTRYFPEAVAMLTEQLTRPCILDGELVVRSGEPGAQRLDWELISARIHPAASRIERLSKETPAELVCFDLLALDGTDWTMRPLRQRRAALEEVLATTDSPQLHLSRATTDLATAQDWFDHFEGAGLDGVIAKRLDGGYEQGQRTMLKVKHKRTAEAVVVGYRVHKSGHGVGSLLLGMYDHDGELVPVGGIGALGQSMREALVDELAPLVVDVSSPDAQVVTRPRSRFSSNPDDSVVPLEPALVVEVAFDQLEGHRFRHAVTLLRFRPDRDPASCLLDQVGRAVAHDLGEVFTDITEVRLT